MKSTTGVPWLAARLAEVLTRRHAWREAILGDLYEEFATISGSAGERAARSWYWRQLVRSALPLLRAVGPDWVPFSLSLAAAAVAYTAILGADAVATQVLTRISAAPGKMIAAGITFGAIIAVGVIAVRMTRRVRYRMFAVLSLFLIAGLFGARHILRSRPGERGYRAGKVAAVMAAIGLGGAPPIPRLRRLQSPPR